MRQVAAIIFCGASVAFATWMIAPSWPSEKASSRTMSSAPSAVSDVAKLDKELTRLEARVPVAPVAPNGDRDPFGFAAVPVATRAVVPAPVVAPLPPAPPAPVLPKLIAISTKDTPAGQVRTAALSTSTGVLLAHPGDTVGTLVVHSIADGVVELVDPSTGTAYRVR